jgi:hypothetical protein
MKTTSMKTIAFAMTAACVLPLSSINAHEGHDHAVKPPAPQAGTSVEAWTNAQASFKAIQAAAQTKQQATIHDEQEKLVVSLKFIQEKGIGGTDKVRLDGAIKNAIAASEKVHVAADANDFAKVESSLKTLEATMAIVEKHVTTTPAK